jgi:3,4-dihydroxy 2-butanone 4-phosphate synthase/GTP cyclohydrolase II
VARDAKPADLVQPGHIFPVRAVPGGVLVRAGHTEAGCDLTAMAGLTPAAVICEILKPDGTMARLPDLVQFAREHGLKIGTIADLIQYRSEHESIVKRVGKRTMQTAWGEFEAVAYEDAATGSAHLALVHGNVTPDAETLVRVHEPASVLDVLDTGASPHSWGVAQALQAIAASPAGVLVLMNCQSSTEHLFGQIAGWKDSKAQANPGNADRYGLRTYGIGAQILRDLNVGQMKLLARPRKMPSMAGFSLTITGYDCDPPNTPATH